MLRAAGDRTLACRDARTIRECHEPVHAARCGTDPHRHLRQDTGAADHRDPGGAGLQFAVLDAEHAPWDRGSLDIALLAGRAVGLPLFVRVLGGRAGHILAALDQGSASVLVPHVDSAGQAREAVAHARYVGGDRGYSGSPRAAGYGSLGMKQALRRGDTAHVICQIESEAAVDAAAVIAAVPGVAGLFVGRADLALSMGLDTTQHVRVDEATEHVMQAAKAAGKLIGVAVGSVAERVAYAARGARWIVQSSDQALLRQAAQAIPQTVAAAEPSSGAAP